MEEQDVKVLIIFLFSTQILDACKCSYFTLAVKLLQIL